VDAYFASTGRSPRGGARLWVKSAVVVAWAAASWIAVVFAASNWWQVGLAGASLGLAIAGIGFNVQHDGGHGAFSRRPWANRATAWMLDLIGGSSYIWHHKHNILHHHATNVDGVDDDIQAEPFLRLSPRQRRRWYHRFQHLYVWPLYAFLPPKWQTWDDLSQWLRARVGDHRIPRPKGIELTWLLAGKVLFFGWVLVVPMWIHPVVNVLATYAWVSLVVGVTLGTVFQLAHCVTEAEFPGRPEDGERLDRSWTEHQLATTVDFCPRNPLLTWYLGGLNFQVEHHLFPRISHVHYPAIAPIVREVCAQFGVRHVSHARLTDALASHVRFLKRLGRTDDGLAGASAAAA